MMKWGILLLLGLMVIAHIHADELGEIDDIDTIDEVDDEDEELLRALEEKKLYNDLDRENEIANKIAAEELSKLNSLTNPVVEIDLCEKVHCGPGRVCELIGTEAKCVCIPECPELEDKRRLVCTNNNETWPSDCAVYQQRCLCATNAAGCKNPDNLHLHIDYYGACHEQKECTEENMADFPIRMRDWLFNVMRDLAERDVLTEHYMQMELEAETNLTRRWSNAAIWKWCDLDGDEDRSVSRHELFPIRAPLVSLEHCIAPFLETCDSDNDHRISLREWGQCLKLKDGELDERCDDIQRASPHLLG